MKKFLLIIGLVVAGFTVFAATPVLAQVTPTSNNGINEACAENPTAAFCVDRSPGATPQANPLYGPNGLLTKAARIIAVVTGIISMFIISIAALRFINSQGDSQKVASARQALIFALVGLVIAASAQVIAVFILNQVG